ncbi:CCA tRNA nucleotidyltransferase [Fusibacter ferrireducens]|uniref:CCA tRNA nucleotidyltransferase n=1 Tax=Fusibacter ferrireducens TaxID=2785058 RepID=A0ABR9ZT95_9FIRM|nr:CCA tRNA nucleotidyltransferase [Fusibacter ferrireducens]MBF4693668.1 CCA tRNA nucleotidyltransferase [Fusibacter ferrireducens]
MISHELLKRILEYQKQTSKQVYIVGGFIRDILLGIESYDLDFTFEASKTGIMPLYERIQEMHEATLCSEFQTMRFESEDQIHFDIATMRKETYNKTLNRYEYEAASLKWDILRRDFTINTAYVKLNDSLLELLTTYLRERRIDEALVNYLKSHICASHPLFYTDMSLKKVRLLHLNSFNEDPSRILRAVKIVNQLDFRMDEETLNALSNALYEDKLLELPLSRIQLEFSKLFKGDLWQKNLKMLMAFNWQEINYGDMFLKTFKNESEEKRTLLMSRFITHIEWLYGVDHQIKKCHEAYNRTLEAFLNNAEINDYNLYKLLYNKRIETLNLMAHHYRDQIMHYEINLKQYSLNLTGHDLIRMGIPQNECIRKFMDALLEYKINHHLDLSLEDEIKYIESIKHEY